jgi:DNA-binding SARP family transcriptional activator
MEFRILGPLEVSEEGRQVGLGGGKQHALLAMLLLHSNEVVSSDRLIDALWDEDPPETAQKALQVYVSGLRKALGKERLETRPPGYRLRVAEDELDLARFQRLAEEQPREALALWRGEPLSEFSYQRFAQTEIARLEELRLACLERRIEEDLKQGSQAGLVSELERLVREHPLRERLRAQLMLALYRSGRQAEALETYQDGRRALTEELGIEPSAELRELQQAILRQDAALALTTEHSRVASAATAESAPQVTPASASARRRLREARKTVTVLSCEVAVTGAQIDPETLRSMTIRVLEELVPVLELHGATVERSIGGAVTAIFGIPAVHEDDPLRAARAAIEMRERLRQVNDELGGTLVLRTGIGTGEVVTGGGGGQAYAAGEPFHSALRLQQSAEPGDVLLDERTRRALRDAVDTETSPGGMRLIGLRLHPTASRPRPRSPLVGRERERRRLHEAFEQAVESRTCQLFTILGAAGVGKSRLVAEFVGDLGITATVARGRCLPYGEGITFWPVLEAVRDAAELDDADSPEQCLAKLEAILDAEDDALRVVPRLAEVIGLREELSSAEDTFFAVRSFFESLARRRPLVVVFDDIHWGEMTYLDLLDHLADWTRDAPVMLLCMARPELLETRSGWGGGKLNAVTALLEPLTESQSSKLVDNLAGHAELDESARQQIVNAAGGNPLFVEEMLALALEDGGADELVVPATIQALLAARLDRLSDGERAAIEAASVEGQVFHESSVATLVSADVRSDLSTLVRKDLIRPERPVFSGERAFRFRHLLIRDASYESIPKAVRSMLHERHADWLEGKAADRALEFEEILGYHLEQAHDYCSELGSVDDHVREIGRRAALRLGAAGRRAFTRVDAPAAVNLISRAIALLPPEDPLRVELVPNVRSIQGTTDLAWAEAILSDAIAAGDPLVAAHARVQQGFLELFFASRASRPEELIRVAENAIAVFEEHRDDLGLARAWRLIAQAHYLGRHGELSAQAAEHALQFAQRAADDVEQLETIEWLGIALLLGPTHATEGTLKCDRLLELVSGHARLELTVLGTRAYMVGIQGHAEEADALIERGRQLMEETNESAWLFPVLMGFYFGWVTEPAAAERELRPLYEALKRIGEKSHFCSVATMLAQAVYDQGRYEEADRLAVDAERTARPNDVHSHIVWRGTRAKVRARRGDVEVAEALAREAVAYAEESDFLHSHAEALMDLAEVLEIAGRPQEAVRAVEQAISLHERKGNVIAAARAKERLRALVAPHTGGRA